MIDSIHMETVSCLLSERPDLLRNEGSLVKASCIIMDKILKVIKYCASKNKTKQNKKQGEMRKANIENKIKTILNLQVVLEISNNLIT